MATSFVSPGLYTREDDQSVYVSALSGTRLGVVTTASWGPVNDPTIITSSANLFDTFGPLTGASAYSASTDTYPDMPGLYAIERYMRRGRLATVVRVATDDATKSSGRLPGVTTNRTAPSKSTIYPAPTSALAALTLDDGDGEVSGEYSADATYWVTYTWVNDSGESLPWEGDSITLGEGISSISITLPTGQLDTAYSHVNIYVTPAGATSAATAQYVGKFEWASEAVINLAIKPVDRSSDVFEVEAAYPGTFGDRLRVRVVRGVRSTPAKPTYKLITLIAPVDNNHATVLTPKQVEAFDGIECDREVLSNNSNSYTNNPNYGPTRVNDGFSTYVNLSLIQPPSSGTVSGLSEPASAVVPADDSGFTGRLRAGQYRVGYTLVKSSTLEETTLGSSPTNITLTGTNGAITFSLTNINIDAGYIRVYISNRLDDTPPNDETLYLVSEVPVLNQKAFALIEHTADQQVPSPTPSGSTWHVQLSGGNDGLPALGDSATYIGVPATDSTSATGLQLFRNKEAIRVSLLAVPGVYDAAVVSELIDIAESGRGDCLALIDPPPALTPEGVMQWHNGLRGEDYDPTFALDSSYAALFWPWCQVNDSYNSVNTPTGVAGQKLYLPPSAFAAEAIAFTDYVSDPWFAPAGLNRGRITGITKVQYTPNQGDRDLLYSEGNAVNSIATFSQTGVAIWGQRTLQRTPTALDRINVRRLMIYLREQIRAASLRLVFEPNTPSMWRRFTGIVEPFLRSVKNRQGVVDFKIVMDSSTNPPEVIEQNMARGIIYIKPTKTAEIIVLDFVVTNQSSNFDETVA